jgi:hypothetical protein
MRALLLAALIAGAVGALSGVRGGDCEFYLSHLLADPHKEAENALLHPHAPRYHFAY